MRLATSLVAALVISTQVAAPVAEACGGYVDRAPAMFLVASHHGRTFVLLGGAIPETAALDWKGDAMSYDRTEIAKAPALAGAFEFTLAGDTTSRTMRSKNQVFITPVFESKRAMTALEIFPRRDEGVRIAVEGKHATSWAHVEQLDDARHSAIPGTELRLTTSYDERGATTSIDTKAGLPWGRYRGAPLGMVTVDGEQFLVLVDDGRITPVRL